MTIFGQVEPVDWFCCAWPHDELYGSGTMGMGLSVMGMFGILFGYLEIWRFDSSSWAPVAKVKVRQFISY